MNHIVLNNQQAQVVLQANQPLEGTEQGTSLARSPAPPIEVRDEQGRTIGHLVPLSPEDIEAIAQSKRTRAAGGRRIPSAEVQSHLKRLEAIRATEGLDEPKMLELLRRMRAGE